MIEYDTEAPPQGELTQNHAIAAYLEGGGTLTSLDALIKFKCLRLSGRIYDLQRPPYNLTILKRTKTLSSGKRVAEYFADRRKHAR